MKTSNQIPGTIQLVGKSTFVFAFAGLMMLSMLFNLFADDLQTEAPESKINKRVAVEKATLQQIMENTIRINDENYIFNDKTKFFRGNIDWQRYKIAVTDIVAPCAVNFTYCTYTNYSEGIPYKPQDKVLLSVSVLNK